MVQKIYEEEFNEKVIKSNKPVLVDFFADWCGPCKMLSPVIDTLQGENSDFDFFKINVDENQNLATSFGVSSIPCVLIFKDGEVVDRSVGFKTFGQMQDIIDKCR